ncbi:MAG: chitosanase [Propionicimonas sp.]|nr:chitosanase [Propionicimonas sp.]
MVQWSGMVWACAVIGVVALNGCSSPPMPSSAATDAGSPAVMTPASPSVPASIAPSAVSPSPGRIGLDDPAKKELAMELVSSAENSSLDWKAQYRYLEDIDDGRGYTGGIIGFCSGTGDMLEVVEAYTAVAPSNPLARFLPALRKVNGTDSHAGLGKAFENAWEAAAGDPAFQAAQDDERDQVYFDPAVAQGRSDGLSTLGQFLYYDAMVMHGPGDDPESFGGIRQAAVAQAKPPSEGGDETAYLNAFLAARIVVMKAEEAHADTSRIDDAQRVFLAAGNFDLNPPLDWKVYGDDYHVG